MSRVSTQPPEVQHSLTAGDIKATEGERFSRGKKSVSTNWSSYLACKCQQPIHIKPRT